MKKTTKAPSAVVNRRARFDYAIGEEIVAGLSLTGLEVRAARDGHVSLKGSFIAVRDGDLWLNNASFSLRLNTKEYTDRTVDTSPRRLLLKRQQIDSLIAQRQSGYSIVPLRMITSGRYLKIVIALGKGKKNYDKRETLKRRDQERETNRVLQRGKE